MKRHRGRRNRTGILQKLEDMKEVTIELRRSYFLRMNEIWHSKKENWYTKSILNKN